MLLHYMIGVAGLYRQLTASGKNNGKPIATLVNYATHPEILGTDT